MSIAKTSAAAPEPARLKSSYSGAEGGECVEVAPGTAAVRIRDSKDVAGPVLTVSPQAWADFVRAAGRIAGGHLPRNWLPSS